MSTVSSPLLRTRARSALAILVPSLAEPHSMPPTEEPFAAGSSVNAGAVVSNGTVYWGSGYTNLGPLGTGNNKFYAFSTK